MNAQSHAPQEKQIPGSDVAPDPLDEALQFLRMNAAFYCRGEYTAPWGFEMPALPGHMSFHAVTSGWCVLEKKGVGRITLTKGDLVVVPLGDVHVMASDENVTFFPQVDRLPMQYESDNYAILRHGAGGQPTTLLCGALRFGHPAAAELMSLLPGLIHVDTTSSPELRWMASTLELLAEEAQMQRLGGETVMGRLADLVVIQAVRHWIAEEPHAQAGWIAALRDERIGKAISLIQSNPSKNWSVADLASELGMSRSAFSARFTELVEEPAMQYITRWKMNQALGELADKGRSVAEVAFGLGYQSEAAFSRAFKRVLGISPGQVKSITDLPRGGPAAG